MAVAEIDVGPLPPNAKAVLVDYRAVGESAYVKLGETGSRVSRWTVPAEPDILIRARLRYTLRDGKSHVGPGIEKPFKASDKVADRPSTTALVVPEPVVKQTDGPVLEVVQDVPHGSDPNEFIVEVAQGLPAATAAKDGIHAGYTAPGEPLNLHAWDGGQTVWTRLVRLADGRTTDWASVEAATVTSTLAPSVDHDNSFGAVGATIGKWGGSSNPASMEVTGGDLLHKAIYAGDIAGYAGDLTDIYAGDMLLRWPGRYTTANIALGFNESIMVGVEPDFTSVSRPVRYAGSWTEYAGGPPQFHTDTIAPGAAGEPVDLRVLRDGLTAGGGDEVPARIDVDIATSSTASPTFGAADFAPLVPGKVYADVNTYALRYTIYADYNKTITIDNLYARRWIWCRRRPWHTHSDAFELIHNHVGGTDAGSFTFSGLNVAAHDEVRIEIQWKNADASPSQLFLRINNDSGSNYYKDGAAAATSLLVGGGTLAAGWWEHAEIRIVNPQAGAERAFHVRTLARWSDTDSEAPAAPSTVMWDNTADAITSIVVDATVGATPIGAGSIKRLWVKRHQEE